LIFGFWFWLLTEVIWQLVQTIKTCLNKECHLKFISSKNNIKYLRNKDFYQNCKKDNMGFSIMPIDDYVV